MKCVVIAAMALGASLSVVAADDPASVLARILLEKGTITSSELARVDSAANPDKAAVLASILADKGVLSSSELARVKGVGGAERAAAAPAPPTPPMPVPKAPAPPKVGDGPSLVDESKAKVSIYGTVLLNAFYNTSLNNLEDIPLFAAQPTPTVVGNDKSFGMTVRQSRIGLKFEGPEVAGAKVSGQAEVDFLGGQAAFANGISMDLVRLRLAFGRMDWKNFSLEGGLDWSVFAPLNPTSLAEFAIPGLSASGNPWIRTPQLRGEYHKAVLGEAVELKWQFAAVDPNMGDYNTTVFSSTRTPGIGDRGRAPGAESRVGLTFDEGSHKYDIGLSGHYARGKNVGTVGAATLETPVDSWGAAIDYSLPFTSWFDFSGEWFAGRALGIFSVASGESVLPVGTPGEHGVESRGGWTQAQFNFLRKWQTNLGYGIEAQRNKNLRVGDRSRNQTYYGNLMYKYNQHLTFAWELRRFMTDWKGQPFANAAGFHANLAIAYGF
jgi:hypothetical protein